MTKSLTEYVVSNEAPEDFYCPITHEIMREPLTTKSGVNFERKAILSWLKDHSNTCPLTREPLPLRNLIPNRQLEWKIRAWCLTHDIDFSSPGKSHTPDENDVEKVDAMICLVPILETDAPNRENVTERIERAERRRNRYFFRRGPLFRRTARI